MTGDNGHNASGGNQEGAGVEAWLKTHQRTLIWGGIALAVVIAAIVIVIVNATAPCTNVCVNVGCCPARP